MKIENFDGVADAVARFRKLEAALDAAKYNGIVCAVSRAGNHYDIAELTSVTCVRDTFVVMLDAEIRRVKEVLHLYGVTFND
jgi:hypothetical protein